MVKRYDCDVCYDVGMTSHASGDWVSYSDYAALLKELESKIALLEVQLKLSEAAERAWESSMMRACGEDGPKSVADKFAELESKLETALRECRSAGITIDNLEVKCAALLDELDKWKQESSAWQAVAEKQLALAASADQKIAELESLIAPQLPQQAPVSVPEVVVGKMFQRK